MARHLSAFLFLLLIGCAGSSNVRTTDSDAANRLFQKAAEAQAETGRSAPEVISVQEVGASTDSLETVEVLPVVAPDTAVVAVLDTSRVETLDVIPRQLEEARTAYLAALEAQDAGDTVQCEIYFENALQIINDLSEFPDIESNADFLDLSSSIVEDYEKHIASIHQLSPYASLYALREKLSELVEAPSDTTIRGIPRHDIRGMKVPLGFNEHVERNISFFMGRGREYMERWIALSGKYFPMMRRVFREEGVPEELIILSMPESGLRTDARSWVGAVGLWQFMKGTGALYGLRNTWWYDERRDFEKATHAAARHLKDLYAEFGDWYHVLGAYNAGPGRIFRAIRRSGSTDFWEMRSHLPRQTRNYIPQYIAVARIVLQPSLYGFAGIRPMDSLAFETVSIDECVGLNVLAACAGTQAEALKELNPELLQWCTPPGVTGYRLRIPVGTRDTFLMRYAAIPTDQKRDWTMHTVRAGETLSGIADRYGITMALVADLNNIKNSRRLSIGAKLAIPVPKEVAARKGKVPFEYDRPSRQVSFSASKRYADRAGSSPARTSKRPARKTRLEYKVKRGDTMGHIAEWYGVRASDIRNWNGISYGSFIRPGDVLAIYVDPADGQRFKAVNEQSFSEKQAGLAVRPRSVEEIRASVERAHGAGEWSEHTVRSGESLDRIAREYGVSVSDLRLWNGLRSNSIRVGQKLEVFERPEQRASIVGPLPLTLRNNAPSGRSNGTQATQHRVKRGETLFQISQSYAVSVDKIKSANALRSNRLEVGQILKIPRAEAAEGSRSHRVRSGDTLWEISRRYGVTVQDLERANNLNGGLRVGDEIVIPSR